MARRADPTPTAALALRARPAGDDAPFDRLEHALTEQIRNLLSAPFAAVLLVAFLVRHDAACHWRPWLAAIAATCAAHFAALVTLRRRRRLEPDAPFSSTQLLPTEIANAVAWSLAIAALHRPGPIGLNDVVVLMFLIAGATINIVGNAADRTLFLGWQVPMCGVPAAWLIAQGGDGVLLGVGALLFLVISTALHASTHQSIVRAISLHHHNASLLDDLGAEQRRVEAMNHELVRVNATLAWRAGHDPLTGLPNRALFLDHLQRAVALRRRERGSLAVLYFDVDRFKSLNDGFGHAAGDTLLREIGARVQGTLRASDVCARLGGDEFTALLMSYASPADVAAVADRLRRRLCEPYTVEGRAVSVTTSIGVAVASGDDLDAETLLKHADAALNRAKTGGRDRVELFDDALRRALAERVRVEAELRHALEQGQIAAWYQPEVDLRTGAVLGAEALVRWIHPQRGVVFPAEFISVAEETGLVVRLGEAVLHQAARFSAAERARRGRPFRVRVNISAVQLRRGDVDRVVRDALAATGCPPECLAIEVTETAVIDDLAATTAQLQRVRELGVGVSLDDFGTGYSSLSLARRLPIDGLKIDRSFVVDVASSKVDRGVVAAVVALAAHLDLSVTAEGIEHEEQARVLRGLGCHTAQGWLYGKAVAPSDFDVESVRDTA